MHARHYYWSNYLLTTPSNVIDILQADKDGVAITRSLLLSISTKPGIFGSLTVLSYDVTCTDAATTSTETTIDNRDVNVPSTNIAFL